MPRATRLTTGGARTRKSIREAAVKLFYEQGYEATSLRGVAAAVDLQVGSLYNHINGKEDLLADIMISVMDELLDAVHDAVDAAGPSALDRYKAAVAAHIRYHAEHAQQVFIGNSELRSLSVDNKTKVLTKRAEYESLFLRLVKKVAAETGADVLDPKIQAYSVLAQGAHVSSWYRPSGPKPLDKLVDTYIQLAVRELGLPND
ncbi:TetR/AcrR family transcriptional regulator [Gordonia rhizosphera]|uniref:Putative TetR family transcriptional regulator n=1 Tax=Gordonia rhizosphera NBRC 16068 TaxID=1108045 RepID=K6W798_9ACTN|nr:TetR/AcrR family transcriptional regulator [Gordonia rhizosphera]GAB89601.1 putative TetR family transcriptional regulator [Gordonia rhizosphera NBRC 16068]